MSLRARLAEPEDWALIQRWYGNEDFFMLTKNPNYCTSIMIRALFVQGYPFMLSTEDAKVGIGYVRMWQPYRIAQIDYRPAPDQTDSDPLESLTVLHRVVRETHNPRVMMRFGYEFDEYGNGLFESSGYMHSGYRSMAVYYRRQYWGQIIQTLLID